MIPQHSGAPHRQQRWVELENISGVEIPAFAALEITDSYRPEKTGGKTPNGGRTVLKVTKPTEDGAKANIINGPCAIPIAGIGYPGTMHDPMLAKVNAEYAAGDEIGLTENSFELTSVATGFIALGDYESGVMRVMRSASPAEQVNIKRCCLAEDHPGCGVVFDLKVGVWSSTTHKWAYPGSADAKGIDHWYSTTVPYPGEGATGNFIERPSDTYGTIWEALGNVSCDSDNCGECGGGY
jgi:hypothetical protein